jgi:cyclin-dependent kinase
LYYVLWADQICFWKRLLGTPSEEQWPGVSGLRDWHEFPQWKPQSLARAVPTMEPEGVDLLSVSLSVPESVKPAT